MKAWKDKALGKAPKGGQDKGRGATSPPGVLAGLGGGGSTLSAVTLPTVFNRRDAAAAAAAEAARAALDAEAAKVHLWPAWKCVAYVDGPSHPGTPIPSSGAPLARLEDA